MYYINISVPSTLHTFFPKQMCYISIYYIIYLYIINLPLYHFLAFHEPITGQLRHRNYSSMDPVWLSYIYRENPVTGRLEIALEECLKESKTESALLVY